RLQQPGDDVEDRALAAARGPDQADEAALRDRERDGGERLEDAGRVVGRNAGLERHSDVVDAKLRGRVRHAPFRHPWRCTEIPPDPEARLAKAVPARKGRCTGDGSSSQRTDGGKLFQMRKVSASAAGAAGIAFSVQ